MYAAKTQKQLEANAIDDARDVGSTRCRSAGPVSRGLLQGLSVDEGTVADPIDVRGVGHQLLVGAALDDPALVNHDDPVCVLHLRPRARTVAVRARVRRSDIRRQGSGTTREMGCRTRGRGQQG